MSWRGRRQLVAILIILAPFFIAALLLFPKIFPAPSCFDNKQNQGETGVDCGGPCAPCELKNPRPISILWAKAVYLRPNTYDAVAEIQNMNEVLSSADAEYEFTLFDELGLVARKTGRTFIFAQEKTPVIETNLTTVREPIKVEFRILNVDWDSRQEPAPNLVVEKRDYQAVGTDSAKQSVIEAVILNKSPFGYKKVEVSFMALDKDGNLLGANKLVMENFLSGEERNLKAIWPEEFKGTVDSIEVKPRVNIFDPAVILRPQ